MKIVTYNLNGIRSALNRGFLQWLDENKFDVICMQELKAEPGQLDATLFHNLGYETFWCPAEKKGYSGVAIFSKIKPRHVEYGCNNPVYDKEGRVVRIDIGDISVLSIYFPSGTTGEIRQAVKYEFLDFIFNYLQELRKTRNKLIVCGDYNIAHKEIDIHNPVSNKNSSGFLPQERKWMDTFFESGFVDAFRHLNAEKNQYTWWSFRANARANNKGWRIDYISVTDNLVHQLQSVKIMPDALHSDHCPMMIEINTDIFDTK